MFPFPQTRLAGEPGADFNYVEGFVVKAGYDSTDGSLGPIAAESRDDAVNADVVRGVPVPPNLVQRRIWLILEFAFNVFGDIVGYYVGQEIFRIPWQGHSL